MIKSVYIIMLIIFQPQLPVNRFLRLLVTGLRLLWLGTRRNPFRMDRTWDMTPVLTTMTKGQPLDHSFNGHNLLYYRFSIYFPEINV